MTRPDLGNLRACVREVAKLFAEEEEPPDLSDDAPAVGRARRRLPRVYRRAFGDPVYRLRERWDEEHAYYTDARRAIVQQGSPELGQQTSALQEVVADVYDGYLSEADRAGVWKPDRTIRAPIVAWGPAEGEGPYHLAAYPEEGLRCGIVVLPVTHARGALVGWTFLAHEVAGHDIVGAKAGLHDEIARHLRSRQALRGTGLGRYFARRLEETICDVLGVLNMGPAAALGLCAYFRGWNAGLGGPARLSREDVGGEHPMDALRGLVVAQTVQLLEFDDVDEWHAAILEQVRADVGGAVTVGGRTIGLGEAVEAARVVAQTIATWSLHELGGLSLKRIQNWRNDDEAIVDRLRGHIRRPSSIPASFPDDHYAAHALAAGVLESMRGRRSLSVIFQRTVSILQRMQHGNRVWGSD